MTFVSRLDFVLGRSRKHNLFFKASKCSFGFKELEFVGKAVSEAGLKVSQQKNSSRPRFSITSRRQTTEEFF